MCNMNGRYENWTMTKGANGALTEKDFVTEEIGDTSWTFTDQKKGEKVVWRAGMELEMRPGEQDEIIGHPTRVLLLGFDTKTARSFGPGLVKVRVVEASPLSRGSFDVGKEIVLNSELARGAYQIPVRAAAFAA